MCIRDRVNGQWWRTTTTQQMRWWGTLGRSGLESAWTHYKTYSDPPGVRVIGTGDRDQAFDGLRHFFLSQTGQAENAAARTEARAAAWRRYELALRDLARIGYQIFPLSGYLALTDDECTAGEKVTGCIDNAEAQ